MLRAMCELLLHQCSVCRRASQCRPCHVSVCGHSLSLSCVPDCSSLANEVNVGAGEGLAGGSQPGQLDFLQPVALSSSKRPENAARWASKGGAPLLGCPGLCWEANSSPDHRAWAYILDAPQDWGISRDEVMSEAYLCVPTSQDSS